jgi:hypothetical protein
MNRNLDYFSIEIMSQSRGDQGDLNIKALLSAIIDEAVREWLSFKNPKNRGKKQLMEIGKDAEAWLFKERPENLREIYEYEKLSDYKKDAFMAFESICTVLDWSPSWIRSTLKKMVREKKFYKTGRRRESALTPAEDLFDIFITD